MKGEKAMHGRRVRTTRTLFTRGMPGSIGDVIPAGTVAIFFRPDELRRPGGHPLWPRSPGEVIISGVGREDFELLPEEPGQMPPQEPPPRPTPDL